MKQIILLATFILATILCFGQNEHLKPARDFAQYEDVLKEYYDNLFPKLYKGFSETPYARCTIIPSFIIEYAFSVETIDNKYYVISNSFSDSFWYSKNRKAVKLVTNKAKIDSILYSRVGELFQILIEQMKEPEQRIFGLDGATYYFATTDINGEKK